jgi:hypothetical protein
VHEHPGPANERLRGRTGGPWASSSGGATRETSGSESVAPLHVAAYNRTHGGPVPTVEQYAAAIRMLCDRRAVSQVLRVKRQAVRAGPKHVVTKRLDAGPSPADTRKLLDCIDMGSLGRLSGPGAPQCHALRLARVSAVLEMRRQENMTSRPTTGRRRRLPR